jgi:hypothetical protein
MMLSAGRQRVGVAQVDLLLPGPPSWWLNSTEMPIASSIVITSRRKSCPPPCAVWSKKPLWSTGTASAELVGCLNRKNSISGMRVEGEAEVGRLAEAALEHVARVGVGRAAVGHRDVAEHPGCRRRLPAPREDLERRRVRLGQHVAS